MLIRDIHLYSDGVDLTVAAPRGMVGFRRRAS